MYHDRACALVHLGRNDEALTTYDQAIAQSSRQGYLLTEKGSVLEQAARFEEALATYNAALAGGYTAPYVWRQKVNLLTQQGKTGEVEQARQEAHEHGCEW